MHFCRQRLTEILSLPEIDTKTRAALVHQFRYGSQLWKLLEQIPIPSEALPTLDPYLLALRRLVRKDLGELRATHRVAAIKAPARNFGLYFLALEEAVNLPHSSDLPPLVADTTLRAYFSLVPKTAPFAQRRLLKDLQVRGWLEGVRRQIATGDDTHLLFLHFVQLEANRGTGDVELGIYVVETLASSMESRGNCNFLEQAIELRKGAVDLLTKIAEPDRVAESMADLADAIRRLDPGSASANHFYCHARSLLTQLDPNLNLPLRRRLAESPGEKCHA